MKYLILVALFLIGCGVEIQQNYVVPNPPNGLGLGTALLSWTPPTENTDGSPLTDLSGYVIYYGNDLTTWSTNIQIDAGLTSYLIEELPTGFYYFMMRSVNSNNVFSSDSNVVTKDIII